VSLIFFVVLGMTQLSSFHGLLPIENSLQYIGFAQLLFGPKARVVTIPLPTIAPYDLQIRITDMGIVV